MPDGWKSLNGDWNAGLPSRVFRSPVKHVQQRHRVTKHLFCLLSGGTRRGGWILVLPTLRIRRELLRVALNAVVRNLEVQNDAILRR